MNTDLIPLYPTREQFVSLTDEEIVDILLMVEQIKPEEIASPGQLMQVGPYNFSQVRMAIAGQALACTYPGRWSQKQVAGDKIARLYIYYPSGDSVLPKSVKLELSGNRAFILEFQFPILEPEPGFDSVMIRYADFRQRPPHITFLSQMQEGATLKDIWHMWSGLRFLCRNLRQWEQEGITYPEDI